MSRRWGASYARLTIPDTNDRSDIYVMDLANRTVSIETLAADGHASDRESVSPRLSGDGRILAYETSDEDQRASIARAIVVVQTGGVARFRSHVVAAKPQRQKRESGGER